MKTVLLSLMAGLLLLSGCSTAPAPATADWHPGIPAPAWFVGQYQRDSDNREVMTKEEYLLWVKRFYVGSAFYPRGWLQTADELVESVDEPADQILVREKTTTMGQLASAEWAKDNRFRVIDTALVGIWGNALLESIVRGEQLKMLDQILADISQLLSDNIRPADIAPARYYPLRAFGVNFGNGF